MAFAGPPLPTLPINTTTAGEQDHAAVVGLAGGGYVVFWTSAGQDGASGGIYSQRFDADGVAIGAETLVNTTTAGHQDFADAAALDAGGYVVTWTSNGQDGSFDGIFMQRYNAAGVAVGSEAQVNTTTLNSQSDSQVVGLSTGGYAVVWSDFGDPATVRMQIFDASGATVGGEITVATLSENHVGLLPDIAEMDSGRIVVTWSDSTDGALADDPWFQLVRANGTLSGGPVQMNTTAGTHANQAQVVALPSGGFMAVWTESIGATGAVGVGDARIVGRIYDNAGTAVTPEFTVSDDVTHLRYDPAVTLGGDGNVYVAWLEQTTNGEIYVMRGIDETGALLEDQFYISELIPDSSLNRFIDLTTLANGDIVATWQSWFGTSDIVTRRIFTAQDDRRASDLGDAVTLAGGGDLLDALAGDDTVTGGNGDDIVFGNDGRDSLLGSSGSDFLKGGNAGDTLDGGTDTDILEGGDGADSLQGSGGDDSILGEDQGDTLNGGNGLDMLQGGAGSDLLNGNADNDDIWGDHNPFGVWTDGSGAADTLFGGTGDDRLYGGSGDDVLEGGSGDDVLFGDDYDHEGLVSGNDRLIMSAGDDTLNGLDGDDTVDSLFGGGNDDTLDGGLGGDLLDGGSGADRFLYLLGYDRDTLASYDQGQDSVILDEALWIATGARTAQDVLDDFGSLSANGRKFTLDFGGGDKLILKAGSFDLGTLADDFSF